ncbi:MAG: TOMM precursor leader peptide-binding protein [Chloroflexi bacterium]|nr:MAG: TOMM precursor leader peptide-binding protein [Chloroflexota bacterium]
MGHAMQPKLKGDTLFVPVDDGVYFRNNRGSLKIKGKVIYHWVESLAPYLNGGHTLAEITAGLDSEKQTMVTELVNILTAQGFVRDISQDLPHTLSPTEQETYAAELAFIDSYCNSAASRFERFRAHQVLLIGSGLTLSGLVHASLKGGLRQITVMTTPECETDTRRHHEYLDRFHQGDPRQTLTVIGAPRWENEAEVLATLQPFNTIISVSDRPMLARASLLNRLCVMQKKNLLQAVLVDDHAWIGPLVRPDVEACWECAWRRLQGNLSRIHQQFPVYAFANQTTAPLSRFLAGPTAAFVANLLSFEVFKYLTEAGPIETSGHVIEFDLETLRMLKHPFMPHPLCGTCPHPTPRTEVQFLETIQQLEQGAPVDQDLFSKRVAPCFETRLGLFRAIDEGDILQLPVSVSQVIVSNPVPQEYPHNLPALLGCGARFGTARKQGAKLACEVYAASAVDRRRLFSEQVPAPQDPHCQTLPAERFLSEAPLSEAKEWTWAVDLHSGQAYLVPAPLVFPLLRGLNPLNEARLGIGSGMSWAEAISRALLSVCHYLTVTQLASAQKPYPQVDLAAIPLESEEIRQLRILSILDTRQNSCLC